MSKFMFFALVALLHSTLAFAATTNTFPGDGNVGVGVLAPVAPLHVSKGQGHLVRFQSPQNGLLIYSDDSTPTLTNSTNTVTLNATRLGSGASPRLRLAGQGGIELASDANTVHAVVTNSGNVGIGTDSPTAKLTVIGTISAKEVKVTTTGFPDYVFADDYKLRTLDEVEAHIKEHKHLPGIPSAAEVERDGLALSVISKKQMEKIEELTLYLIEMKKENEALKKRMEALEAARTDKHQK